MTAPFLDTNILLRHLLGDHPDQSPRATAWLHNLETTGQIAHAADTVIFEAVFTLERHYHRSKAEIRDALLPLIELPGLQLPGKRRWRTALDLYVNLNLPLADAYHAVLMTHINTTEIVSFDHHFDRIPGIVRREPQGRGSSSVALLWRIAGDGDDVGIACKIPLPHPLPQKGARGANNQSSSPPHGYPLGAERMQVRG